MTARNHIPSTMKRWALYGAGMENLLLETVPTPEPAPDELLVRHDACGICYSDIKIINLGSDHPRLQGRDLAREPVVIGHEVSVTAVKVGSELADRFQPGQRFTIQVDAFCKGERLTYGYKLSGGMAQYGIVGKEILNGDEGCYLLPLKESTGYVQAALCEPWACVTSAYRPQGRTRIKEGGAFAELDTAGIKSESREADGYDDILVTGTPSRELVESALSRLRPGGVINFALDPGTDLVADIDIGRIHYAGIFITGDPSGRPKSPKAAYRWLTRAFRWNTEGNLKPSGSTLFLGAGGPMGQMHVQRAITLKNPPRRVVISDIDEHRLTECYKRFKELAHKHNVELISVLFDQADEYSDHRKLMKIGEFDNIVSLVPSAEMVSFSEGHLAMNGVINVFAGVQIGQTATIEISSLIHRNQRIIGTTGSSLDDMRHTLEMVESGELDTNLSLAAIAGIESLADGLDSVRNGHFPGKIVIFPNINDLPLTGLSELSQTQPDVFAQLSPSGHWTPDAERVLFEKSRAMRTH